MQYGRATMCPVVIPASLDAMLCLCSCLAASTRPNTVTVPAGKRINMKKVIAFIASHFRRDKIWMRRTHPDKRKYQVKHPKLQPIGTILLNAVSCCWCVGAVCITGYSGFASAAALNTP